MTEDDETCSCRQETTATLSTVHLQHEAIVYSPSGKSPQLPRHLCFSATLRIPTATYSSTQMAILNKLKPVASWAALSFSGTAPPRNKSQESIFWGRISKDGLGENRNHDALAGGIHASAGRRYLFFVFFVPNLKLLALIFLLSFVFPSAGK